MGPERNGIKTVTCGRAFGQGSMKRRANLSNLPPPANSKYLRDKATQNTHFRSLGVEVKGVANSYLLLRPGQQGSHREG